jgi:hypothetical protein
MWREFISLGVGIYIGTNYDCKTTVLFITQFLKNNIPNDALPKKK